MVDVVTMMEESSSGWTQQPPYSRDEAEKKSIAGQSRILDSEDLVPRVDSPKIAVELLFKLISASYV